MDKEAQLHTGFSHPGPYQLYKFKVRSSTKMIEALMQAKDWEEGNLLLEEFCLLNGVQRISMEHAVLLSPSGYADMAKQETSHSLVPFSKWPAGSFDAPAGKLDLSEVSSLRVRDILDRVATGKLSAKDALIAEQRRPVSDRRSSLIDRLTSLAGSRGFTSSVEKPVGSQ